MASKGIPPRLVVKEMIASGELEENSKDSEDIINQCGTLLDRSCSHDIVGKVLFKATNGRYYTVHVEAIIKPADKELVSQVLEEIEEDKAQNEAEGTANGVPAK